MIKSFYRLLNHSYDASFDYFTLETISQNTQIFTFDELDFAHIINASLLNKKGVFILFNQNEFLIPNDIFKYHLHLTKDWAFINQSIRKRLIQKKFQSNESQTYRELIKLLR